MWIHIFFFLGIVMFKLFQKPNIWAHIAVKQRLLGKYGQWTSYKIEYINNIRGLSHRKLLPHSSSPKACKHWWIPEKPRKLSSFCTVFRTVVAYHHFQDKQKKQKAVSGVNRISENRLEKKEKTKKINLNLNYVLRNLKNLSC